jgi:hypothetical protein
MLGLHKPLGSLHRQNDDCAAMPHNQRVMSLGASLRLAFRQPSKSVGSENRIARDHADDAAVTLRLSLALDRFALAPIGGAADCGLSVIDYASVCPLRSHTIKQARFESFFI